MNFFDIGAKDMHLKISEAQDILGWDVEVCGCKAQLQRRRNQKIEASPREAIMTLLTDEAILMLFVVPML